MKLASSIKLIKTRISIFLLFQMKNVMYYAQIQLFVTVGFICMQINLDAAIKIIKKPWLNKKQNVSD